MKNQVKRYENDIILYDKEKFYELAISQIPEI